MIKGAIFDVDGTLLDSMEIWEDAGVRYLRRIGVEPEKDLSEILYPMTMTEGAEYVKERYRLTFALDEIVQGVHLIAASVSLAREESISIDRSEVVSPDHTWQDTP